MQLWLHKNYNCINAFTITIIYPLKPRVTKEITILLNDIKYILNINAKINVYLKASKQIEAIINTRSPIVIINKPILAKSFPTLQKKTIKDKKGISLISVKLKPRTSTFIKLPVRCLIVNKTIAAFSLVIAFIVLYLLSGLLLGLSFLIPNRLNIRWGYKRVSD